MALSPTLYHVCLDGVNVRILVITFADYQQTLIGAS